MHSCDVFIRFNDRTLLNRSWSATNTNSSAAIWSTYGPVPSKIAYFDLKLRDTSYLQYQRYNLLSVSCFITQGLLSSSTFSVPCYEASTTLTMRYRLLLMNIATSRRTCRTFTLILVSVLIVATASMWYSRQRAKYRRWQGFGLRPYCLRFIANHDCSCLALFATDWSSAPSLSGSSSSYQETLL